MRDTAINIDEQDTLEFQKAAEENPSHSFKLTVAQQPVSGKAVSTSHRTRGMRWPIEPPPVLELTSGEKEPQKWLYIHNPNWFCVADLIPIESGKKQNAKKDENKEGSKDNLSGLLASSLHKVKNPDDRNEHGYFVFGDLNVRDAGRYKLEFTLFEMRNYKGQVYAAKVDSITSNEFEVSTRGNLTNKDSTKLSKTLSESGVKIRLRKESTKRKGHAFNWSSSHIDNLNYNQPVTLAPLVNMPAMAPPPSNPAGKSYRKDGDDISRRISVSHNRMGGPTGSNVQGTSHSEDQAHGGHPGFNSIRDIQGSQYDYDLQHPLSPGSKLPPGYSPMTHNIQGAFQGIPPRSQQPWTFNGQGAFRPDASSFGLPDPRINHERGDSGYSSHGHSSLASLPHLPLGVSGIDTFNARPQHQFNPTSMPLPQIEPQPHQEWHINASSQGYGAYEGLNPGRQSDMAPQNGGMNYLFGTGQDQPVFANYHHGSQP